MKIQNLIKILLTIILCLIHFNVMADTSKKTVISRVCPNEFYYKVVIGDAGFLITSGTGTTIVTDPRKVPEGVKADIITVSHEHFDHIDYNFLKKMKDSKISLTKTEMFTEKGVTVQGIASAHSTTELTNVPKNVKFTPGNFIYFFIVDGLRIAHMGDMGQSSLTEDQLKTLGKLDIIFLNFENGYGLTVRNSLKVIEQTHPKIIIPTHLDTDGFRQLNKVFSRTDYQKGDLIVDQKYLDNLGNDQIVIFLIPENGSIVEKWKKKL